ncbi:MAG: glycoside hydrolase family protein [Prolixibacteraceae bacterium]|nr:glycoside hydrolase family protein [Prolixibacteraceae bacterium]
MKRAKFFLTVAILFTSLSGFSQKNGMEFEPVPKESGFKMDGYWVWCGSMIKVDSTYHLFASRWKKNGDFPEGYRQNSEIVRATSSSPLGPFQFQEVVIGERDSSFWDSNMAHNPTIHKIGDEYVLFYIGSDFTTLAPNSKSLLRRVGYAKAKQIGGPWIRCDQPVIADESNNPAILHDGKKILLMYRDAALKVFLAEAEHYSGPYKVVNSNLWTEARIEDFYLFKSKGRYHLVCEDNVGKVSGHERWGVHLVSKNGVNDWKRDRKVVVYDHDIRYTDGSVLHCVRRERPQFLVENGKITVLITSVYDGKDTWSQPVILKKPIRLN